MFKKGQINMGAGRPYNSTTPAWRSHAAAKVAAYRFLMANKKQKATKSGCAKYMGIARGTVIKWWDTIKWEKDDFKNIIIIKKYWNEYKNDTYNVEHIHKKCGFEEQYIYMMTAVLHVLFQEEKIKDWHVHYQEIVKQL